MQPGKNSNVLSHVKGVWVCHKQARKAFRIFPVGADDDAFMPNELYNMDLGSINEKVSAIECSYMSVNDV